MPAETFTSTTADVADRVRTIFGDTSGSQVTDAMLIRWINDGQLEIVNNNPVLKAVKYTNFVAGQTEYTFPTDAVQFIEAVYVSGRPVKNVSPQEFREYILAQDPTLDATSEYPDIWYERAGVITFYPKPQTSYTNGLKLEYVKTPTAVTSISTVQVLSIPDRYLNQLVNYVLAQALETDENYTAADRVRSQFREGLDRMNLKENVSQIDSYPSVMPDPEDYNV
jgi:hypothetical protein